MSYINAVLLCTLFLLLLFLYRKKKKISLNPNFWDDLGFPQFSNKTSATSLVTGMGSSWNKDLDYYNQMKDDQKFVGIVEFEHPVLFIKDLKIAQQILIKDFDHFFDRRDFPNLAPLISQSLFSLKGQLWKDMRSFLSPTLTTARIRRMFPKIEWGIGNLTNYINNQPNRIIKLSESMRRFTVETIAAAGFGIHVDIFNNKDDTFYDMSLRLTTFSMWRKIRFSVVQNFPKIAKLLRISAFDGDVITFFNGILSEAFRQRELTHAGERENDFLQFIVEARRDDLSVNDDELSKEEREGFIESRRGKIEWTETLANAQALTFLLAGSNNTANNLSVATYILAQHKDIQREIRDEVRSVLGRNSSKDRDRVTYENVNEFEYMDMFISEVFRLFPPATRLERQCMEDYRIEGTDFVIPKRAIIAIPVEAIHKDEQYYKNPLKFDPNHFSREAKSGRNPYAYMPFGIGPRNCIGMRLALVETKCALANILLMFEVSPVDSVPDVGLGSLFRDVFGCRVLPDLELKFNSLLTNDDE